MPTISQVKLIKEFIESTPDLYDIPEEELIHICCSVFDFVKDCMKKEVPLVRIKHFGKFIIYPNTVKKNLFMLKDKLNKGYITEETFALLTERRKQLLKILEDGKNKQVD